ncbi:MAG: hypothetical protein GY780_04090 [bacterium]|nr:hypothetical protein [bacterium]
MKYIWLAICLILAKPVLSQENNSTTNADTLGNEPYFTDTVVVSAPQVSLDEVIDAIIKRSERDDYLMAQYEYTMLVTQVLRDDPGVEGGNYTLEEYAIRLSYSRELGEQLSTLWERRRKYENGELVEDEIDEEISTEFLPRQDNVIDAPPFTEAGRRKYQYEILDRQLVGNNLIYKISFAPKVKFDALPKGTIWVDYSNWVMRKMEGQMTDAVPYPMFLESIPVYRTSQERFGEFWFPTEFQMRINLRKIPLLPIPDNVEVRVTLQDVIINGEALSPLDSAPGTGYSDITEEEIAEGFWLSEEASNDSLSTYWDRIGDQWEADISDQAIKITLTEAKVDSLTEVGSTQLQDLREGNLWSVKPEWMKAPGYNRTQGYVARVGLKIKKQGRQTPGLNLTAGYAFSNQRPVVSGELSLPLLRSRWTLKDQPTDGSQYKGSLYKVLSLDISGVKDSALFGGDNRRHTRSASSLFYGSDPNHYYEERSLSGQLNWRLSRGLKIHAGGGYAEHRAWEQQTSWNILGRSLSPDGNMAADFLNDIFFNTGAQWTSGALTFAGEITWHDLGDASSVNEKSTMMEMKFDGQLDLLDRYGNQWLLRGSYSGFDGTAPSQWKTWLGDYGSLRGYNAGELTGDSGAHASLDTRFGFDLFQAARVPFLKNWGLQPMGFVDWGKTWDEAQMPPGAENPQEGARGWRMDAGIGFGKRFDVPGLGQFNNVRLYAAHPVFDDSDGHGWRFLLAFEK